MNIPEERLETMRQQRELTAAENLEASRHNFFAYPTTVRLQRHGRGELSDW